MTTPVGDFGDNASAIALQPDGKIVQVGFNVGPGFQFALVRYNRDGSLDTSFNGTGKVVTPIGSFAAANAVAIQADGKIVVGGSASNDGSVTNWALARYNTNGSLDTSFNSTGIVTTAVGSNGQDNLKSLAIQPDGKIVAGGYTDQTLFAVGRYNADGSLDTSFNSTGIVLTVIGGADDQLLGIAIQPDGKIVGAGQSKNGTINNFAVVRYNADGSLDTTFNATGKVTTPIGSVNAVASGVLIQPDGKIVAGGSAGDNNITDTDFAVVRYLAFTPPNRIANFDTNRTTEISLWNPVDHNWYLRIANRTIILNDWGAGSLGDIAVPGDYDGDGRTDFAVYRPSEGNWYVLTFLDNTVLLKNWGTATDKPVPGDYDGDGRTDYAVYRPAEGNWYIFNSRDNTVTLRGWGGGADKPVPADYDGDGRTDIAVFRPAEGNWYLLTSHDGFARVVGWGTATDKLVPADYDGDGRVDVAVFRPSEGNWYIRYWTNTAVLQGWGNSSDVPAPGDYDGDGRADIAIFRPSDLNWYILQSTTSTQRQDTLHQFGIPVPSAYLPQ